MRKKFSQFIEKKTQFVCVLLDLSFAVKHQNKAKRILIFRAIMIKNWLREKDGSKLEREQEQSWALQKDFLKISNQ